MGCERERQHTGTRGVCDIGARAARCFVPRAESRLALSNLSWTCVSLLNLSRRRREGPSDTLNAEYALAIVQDTPSIHYRAG